MEKSIVRISNLLNFTRQEFDVYEQRLLILIIEFLKHKQGIGVDIEEGKNLEVSLNYADFEKDISSNRLKKLANTITSQKIHYEVSEDKWTYLVLFPMVSYESGELKVTIIDKALKYLLELAKGYTNIDKQSIFSLKSSVSMRMYELLSSFKNVGVWTVKIEELREFLNLSHNQYINFKDFRIRVLEYSQRELWEHCNLHFEWEVAAKQRKRITALTFHIRERDKQERIELNEEIEATKDYLKSLSPADISQKANWVIKKYKLSENQQKYILNNTDVFNEFVKVDLIIEDMISKGNPPRNKTSYLAKSLGLDKVKFPKSKKE